MALAVVQITDIEEEQRLRDISEAQVESLIASIGDVGLLNPVTVYERKLVRSGVQVNGYGLVAGAHRLEACRRLGLVEIEANVVALSDLERQIAECDENLCGSVLSKAERALFTRRRKDAYEALHPETKHGTPGVSRQVGDTHDRGDADRFTADTAVKTGQSERAVQRDAERGNRISTPALALIKGSKLDTGKYLDDLKATPKEQQVAKVRADLAQPNTGIGRRFKSADAPLSEEEARERQVSALMTAWNKASKEARDEFLARIDTPVFDRSAA